MRARRPLGECRVALGPSCEEVSWGAHRRRDSTASARSGCGLVCPRSPGPVRIKAGIASSVASASTISTRLRQKAAT
eukprot:3560025-Lingulodinium_polyedra.AAC.1